MGKLLDLTFYNPAQLKDEDFIRGFVARQDLVKKILTKLGKIKKGGLAEHRLILGQRGMGKTSLLRRIAVGVRDTEVITAKLLPLTFREEQYNVHNLHVFWCNCLDALGDFFEATGQKEKVDKVDLEVSSLNKSSDDEEGSAALDAFNRWMKMEGKRPLLMLDNIDLIFKGLKDKQWSLRRELQKSGGIVVIGATSTFLEATADPEAAFYEFFKVDVLEKLGREELISCLRTLAAQRGDAGQKVIEVINRDTARIRVLYDLTGGNPRTLAMLYLMLEMLDDGDLMRDLERLLDQATPLYKARVEELAPQARVVFDAVALNWDPIIAATVANATGIPVAKVSAQLNRMEQDHIVEKITLSSTSKVAYQVAERFFNIWYLMRHAPRRQRSRLRWLTEFLRSFYSPSQLLDTAHCLLKRSGGDCLTSGMYCLALSDAMKDTATRRALRFEAKHQFEGVASDSESSLKDLVDIKEIENPTTFTEWISHAYFLHIRVGAYDKAEEAYRKAIDIDPKNAWPWNNLGALLSEHTTRYEEAEAAFRKSIEIDPQYALPWNNLGALLNKHTTRYEEAEAAFRKSIDIDPNDIWPWNDLGNLLADYLNQLKESEKAYRRALEIDETNLFVIGNLAYLLLGWSERREEGEKFYTQAIDVLPPHGAGVLKAFYALSGDNFGDATNNLKKVLEQEHTELFSIYFDDLLKVLWLAKNRGYGEKLLSWFEESGLKDRYWPLWTAFDAYLLGKNRLQDVNPEVRGAAERIYSRLIRLYSGHS